MNDKKSRIYPDTITNTRLNIKFLYKSSHFRRYYSIPKNIVNGIKFD